MMIIGFEFWGWGYQNLLFRLCFQDFVFKTLFPLEDEMEEFDKLLLEAYGFAISGW